MVGPACRSDAHRRVQAPDGTHRSEADRQAVRATGARTLTRDIVTATALLDGRLLAGDAAVFERFDGSRTDFLARFGEDFLKAKCAEADARHAKHGRSAFASEPNVKESRGALRDLELLRLFERAGSPPVGMSGKASTATR